MVRLTSTLATAAALMLGSGCSSEAGSSPPATTLDVRHGHVPAPPRHATGDSTPTRSPSKRVQLSRNEGRSERHRESNSANDALASAAADSATAESTIPGPESNSIGWGSRPLHFGHTPRFFDPGDRSGNAPAKTELEEAAELAERFLIDSQHPDGHWGGGGRTASSDGPSFDVGALSLSLLAFSHAGNSLRSGPRRPQIRDAVQVLRDRLNSSTGILPTSSQSPELDHAIATLALVEAATRAHSRIVKRDAMSALRRLGPLLSEALAEDPTTPRTAIEAATLAWSALALRVAAENDYDVDSSLVEETSRWFSEARAPRRGQLTIRSRPSNDAAPSTILLASGLLFHALSAERTVEPLSHHEAEQQLAELSAPVEVGATAPLEHWSTPRSSSPRGAAHALLFTTFALHQAGDRYWNVLQEGTLDRLTVAQRIGGDARGSFDPQHVFPGQNDRVRLTALRLLTFKGNQHFRRQLP